MIIGDLNTLILLFLLLTIAVFSNPSSAMQLLLAAEILGITLYAIAAVVGLLANDLNATSLTFFFLVLSAVEFGLGLAIMVFQHVLSRSLNLNNTHLGDLRQSSRILEKLYTGRIKGKI